MSRLQACFQRLAGESRKALIPYVMTGDPQPGVTLPLMHAMVEAGANIIELGAPFSDPMADGPVIQAAAERSLKHHTSLHDVFNVARSFREKDNQTPIVLMGYLNPVEIMGYESFARQASESGIDGVITVDMPPEEAEDYIAALRQYQIDPIFLIAPTTTEERMQKIAAVASGFVYYVSLKGVTGAATLDVAGVVERVSLIRKHISLPIGVGFGINNAQAAASVSSCADAVVVGSAIVNRMAAQKDQKVEQTATIVRDVTELLKSMRDAMDAK
ncbi:MAG: tryptophan synthase subunit alpha [Gammaproteobacteria bacterium]|nr:tryptophan synthase subunit alpha [Gammaproteobacteria bacterium]